MIGAGPAGLTATKNLVHAGFHVDCYDSQHEVGGIWNFANDRSSIHESTRMISSKRLTEFSDFRMPREYPHYPGHRQAFEYLKSYAKHFNLYPYIQLGQSVESVRLTGRAGQADSTERGWIVRTNRQSEAIRYDGVVVANGHHSSPLWPEIPGLRGDTGSGERFAGEVIHARDYRSTEILRGRRVLVIGAGNSGCDLAVEAANYAKSASISMRRGYHFFPKYLFGAPLDRCGENMHRWKIKSVLNGSVYRWITKICLLVTIGKLESTGLPAPDHRLFESHPIVNSKMVDCVRNGKLKVRRDVRRLEGHRIEFTDGSEAEFDLVICATGYKPSFPFLDPAFGTSQLVLNMFDPSVEGLWFIGLIQPDGGIWQLADYQSQLLAKYLQRHQAEGHDNRWLDSLIGSGSSGSPRRDRARYLASPRHAFEVDYFEYRDRLKTLIRKLH